MPAMPDSDGKEMHAVPGGTADYGNDEQSIRDLFDQMTEGFNNHDAVAATKMYAPDAELVTVRGERMRGAAAIEAGLASILSTRARNATLRTLDVTIRFIRPDVAIAHVVNELSGLLGPDNDTLPAHTELSLRVCVKEAGRWRVTAFHNTMMNPFPV